MDALGKFGEHSKSYSCSRLRLELLLRIFRALQTRASITRYTHAKHEQILKFSLLESIGVVENDLRDIKNKRFEED